jgi:DnaJ-class molecular chaperone
VQTCFNIKRHNARPYIFCHFVSPYFECPLAQARKLSANCPTLSIQLSASLQDVETRPSSAKIVKASRLSSRVASGCATCPSANGRGSATRNARAIPGSASASSRTEADLGRQSTTSYACEGCCDDPEGTSTTWQGIHFRRRTGLVNFSFI